MNMFLTKNVKKTTIAVFLFLIGFSHQAVAQVSIAPTSLFFGNQQRFSSITISNGGQQAQEISISTQFGFPANKNGGVSIVTDSALAKTKSISDWLKIFPQNFTLQPQQRQTVRFVARPPNGLSQGGYWSRVKIQSNPVSPPIESVEEGEIGAQVNLVVSQVIPAHYYTQNAQTGVEVTGVTFSQIDSTNNGQIAVSMQQTGNAPFMGSINLQVTDGSGNTVYETQTTNSVYTTITRNFTMDLSDVEPGNYTISGEITSQRRDISEDKLLQITPVPFEKQITIE